MLCQTATLRWITLKMVSKNFSYSTLQFASKKPRVEGVIYLLGKCLPPIQSPILSPKNTRKEREKKKGIARMKSEEKGGENIDIGII